MSGRLRICLAVLVAVLIVGPFVGPVVHYVFNEVKDEAVTLPATIKATPQREGDPVLGKKQLLSESYISCGLPLSIVQKMADRPLSESLQLPGRTGDAADLPYFNNVVTNSDGVKLVTSNCLTCHAAQFNDELVIGLGNEFLDFTEDASRNVERAGLLVQGDLEAHAWKLFADRINAVSPYTIAQTVGVNVANNLTFALMAHLDPVTLKWSEQPVLAPPDADPLPVSVPPWWRVKKKNGMFYQGQGRGDHARFMITAALLCVDGIDEVRAADRYAPNIRAYLESLVAPEYPFSINAELAGSGRLLFETNCSHCHGTYGEQSDYPNLIIPLETIGTDPALALQTADDNHRFNDWFEKSWYGVDTDTVPARGYMPPPLDGIWATAPFLHNGSVPSIDVLLDSSSRPDYWQHATEREFDPVTLGWEYEALESGKSQLNPRENDSRIYDTSLRGYRNGGHTFGDHLSGVERRAVLEYLKTL